MDSKWCVGWFWKLEHGIENIMWDDKERRWTDLLVDTGSNQSTYSTRQSGNIATNKKVLWDQGLQCFQNMMIHRWLNSVSSQSVQTTRSERSSVRTQRVTQLILLFHRMKRLEGYRTCQPTSIQLQPAVNWAMWQGAKLLDQTTKRSHRCADERGKPLDKAQSTKEKIV